MRGKKMPNQYIPLEVGHYYHIWTHANGQENLFREPQNYDFFLKKYTAYLAPIVKTYTYCLMPNHIHLLISVKQDDILRMHFENKFSDQITTDLETSKIARLISQQFSNLLNSYTKSFNKYYNRKGSLFIPNFKRKEVSSEEYLAGLVTYIHNNPVYHKFVHSPDSWSFSSYRFFTSKLKPPLHLDLISCIDWFGGYHEFLKAHNDALKEKVDAHFKQ